MLPILPWKKLQGRHGTYFAVVGIPQGMYPYTTASMPRCDDATVLYDLQELHLDKIQYDAIMCSRSVHLVVRSLSFTFHLISSSRKEHCRPEMAGRLAYRRSNTGRSLTPVLKLHTQPRTVTDDKPPPPVYQFSCCHHQLSPDGSGDRRGEACPVHCICPPIYPI